MSGGPSDVPGLIGALLAADPGRPRVTWYGPDGERVELSAKTLQNWVAKTANLLVEELDAEEPGTVVGIALPIHWRTVVWLLATWSVGGHAVVLPPHPSGSAPDGRSSDGPAPDGPAPDGPAPDGPAPDGPVLDVLVTDRPDAVAGTAPAAHLVAVALPALATRFGPGLPPGALDAATEVRLQPDAFTPPDPPPPDQPAFTSAGRTISYRELLTRHDPGVAARVLTGAGPDAAVRIYLPILAVGGSLVLHHDPAALTDPDRDRLITSERIDVTM